jgi:hypothetical protein
MSTSPLELLLAEEKRLRTFSNLKAPLSFCPYLAVQPYIGAVLKIGKELEIAEFDEETGNLVSKLPDYVALHGFAESWQAAEKLGKKKGIEITTTDLSSYLLHLAEEMDDFGEHFPGINERVAQHFFGKKGIISDQRLEENEKFYFELDYMLRAIGYARSYLASRHADFITGFV